MSRRCKICCGVAALIIVLLLVASLVIFFTILKPKQPKVLGQQVYLQGFEVEPAALKLNVSLLLVITIKNRNYGSFKYTNGTASVYYHGEEVAEVLIEDGEIPARASHVITSSVHVLGDKMLFNTYFFPDLISGWLNFTSSSTMRGKASLFKILKTWATSITDCSIAINTVNRTIDSYCYSQVKV